MQLGYFLTKYGWKYWISPNEKINPRRLINWPIQSHGSEILRRAIIDLDEAGFEISMIIHDAVLIHMKRKGSAKNIRKLKKIMSDAAEKVIGAAIPVDTNIIRKQFNQDGEHKERGRRCSEARASCPLKITGSGCGPRLSTRRRPSGATTAKGEWGETRINSRTHASRCLALGIHHVSIVYTTRQKLFRGDHNLYHIT